MDFSFYLPKVNLIFGKDVLEQASEEIKKLGNNALIVTGKSSMERLGFLDKLKKHLENSNIKAPIFNKITPNPSTELVDEGAKLALDNKCDVIIALGGGSSIDAAKSIAVVAGHSSEQFHSIWEFANSKQPITNKTLPIVAITSTSGSGSHVSRFSVITNPSIGQKLGIPSEYVFPKLSVVDLDIIKNMPPVLTAECGVDVLTHCLEGLISKSCNPITEEMALRGIELVFHHLTEAYRNGDNLRSREGMALADTYAGFVITTSRVILPHAMSHPISAFYPNISHGAALAAITPHIMAFNIERGNDIALQKYCLASSAMGKKIHGINKQEAMKSIEAIKELFSKIGMDKTLKELGVESGKINDMVKSAMVTGQGPLQANPVEVTEKDMVRIYKLAMGR